MSKQIKAVGFDSYEVVEHKDNLIRFKHQTHVQDYIELQKEVEATRGILEAMWLKKLTLQAEVRFLRRRHKFLLKNKSRTRQEPAIIKPQYVEATRYRKNSTNEKVNFKRKVAMQNIKHNGNAYAEKKNVLPGISSHIVHGAMEQFHARATQASDSNQMVRIDSFDLVDLRKDTTFNARAPTFDLNKISREEEELQEEYEPKNSVKSVTDEKFNELNLSICRNILGDASTSQAMKQKISWQDPVALRVFMKV
ncbi:hypothetical protein CTI12_AA163580 [Artemisia annua]|uniref:Uncharacterized protein n=1 Tax=Artemisia annua TaxID=35608 RepID=A0A2U1PE33_ARTAN|nr:hypothetical protein CTI12_AA163580 [Artemisia annua]